MKDQPTDANHFAELTRSVTDAGRRRDPLGKSNLADTDALSGKRINLDFERHAMKICTLGRFFILKDGQPLSFGRKMPRKPLVLLKMLIASGGIGADTGFLSERMWPESDGDAARRSFDVNLHRLRKVLGVPDLLTLSDGKLSFDARKCWIDVWEFEDILERIERAMSKSPDTSDADYPSLANELLCVYEGHFLEHEAQEAWAVAHRDRLKAKFARAVMSLAARLEQHRKWDQAAALYSRALELDNLAESLYRRLMICHRELGETAEALRAYRRCRDLLSVVFSIKPSAETEAIRATFQWAAK